MNVLAFRVASRFIQAGLVQDFNQRVEKLLAYAPDNPPAQEVADFRQWLASTFHFQTRTTPKGYKREKEELDRFWRALAYGENSHGLLPGAFTLSLANLWEQMKPMVPTWVQVFSSSEGKAKTVTREVREGANTYINMVGASDERLSEMISTIEKAFDSLKGWRRKALQGGVRVVFASPKDFRGTASGTYRRATDELWIRATTGGRIERGGSGYGGLTYVIVHELGHRFEQKHGTKFDFERSEWVTSRYSHTDGEQFAELFAISNFDLKGAWDQERVNRFEDLMGG